MFEKKNTDDQLSNINSSLKKLQPGGIICSICRKNPAQTYFCPICGRKSIFPCPNCAQYDLSCSYCISRKII